MDLRPRSSHRQLFDDVARSHHQRAFWWLGQHSFVLKLDETILLIDPFLDDMPERLVPPMFAPEHARAVDIVACTHDHIDHIDPVAVTGLAKHTAASFVAPRAAEARMRSLGVDAGRLVLLDDGETATVQGVRVRAIKAAHETFERTPEGHHAFLGYLFAAGGATVYHAGDTVWWEGLQARLAAQHLDVAMVPINGRDAERLRNDVRGNMVYQEAADLVGPLDVGLVVPCHYGMFDFNTEDPQRFVDYVGIKYPQLEVWVGPPGVEVPFEAGGGDGDRPA
jgi:L-ascorbate 6-phosphate lactonase